MMHAVPLKWAGCGSKIAKMEIVGKSHRRYDALYKARGKAVYVDDLYFPHMLYAGVKRSPHPHARIKKIDPGGLKGKKDVFFVSYEDIPGANKLPIIFDDWPVLAPGVARFAGEAVALVAAPKKELIPELLDEIEVEYEPLEAVFDPELSMKSKVRLFGDNNVFASYYYDTGDIEKGFQDADVIVEDTYRTPYQEHAYIETQGMVAVPTPDGGMEIYGSMQCPFYVQNAVAGVLGIGMNKVRVVQMETGGAFGGKEDMPSQVASQAALLAYVSGHPVKLIYSREEDILSMSKRHPGIIKSRVGAKKDGTLVAVDTTYILDSGAYATLSPAVLWRGTVHACGPYRVPNVRVRSYAVATNKVPCGAFRGFGAPQVIFAMESQMDRIAEELGMDPAELREKNLVREGDTMPYGHKLAGSVGTLETLKKAVEKSGWKEKRKTYGKEEGFKKRGIGLATIFYGVGLGAAGKQLDRSGAYIQITEDGKVAFAVGTTEMGQGMKTALAQIVAEELGFRYEDVAILPTDTSRVPDSGPTVASRATVMSGNALRNAAKPLRETLIKIASELLSVPPEKIELKLGDVYVDGSPKLSLDELIKEAYRRREHMASQGYYVAPHTSWENKEGGEAYMVYAWATKIAEVEVDLLTGEVKVLRITSAHDVGKAVNPTLVEGQIEGGAIQGMGYALMEDILTEGGEIINNNFSTYIIPTIVDAPEIIPIIVEREFDKGPYGAKGFAEQPLMGIAPAITNAIYHATGVRIKELPATPERVFEKLLKAGKVELWKEK